jgi:hypothetical protein
MAPSIEQGPDSTKRRKKEDIMRLNRIATIASVALVAGAIGCSTLQVNSDYAPGTDFSKYKSFSIKRGEAGQYQIAADRVMNALESALKARGFTSVPEGGDLNVFMHVTIGKDTQINTTGYGYGGWGGWRWGGGMQTTTVQQIPTGTLVVDLVDAKTKTAVWRGIAKDEIKTTATSEERNQHVNDAAAQLFAGFPPKASK